MTSWYWKGIVAIIPEKSVHVNNGDNAYAIYVT